MMILCIETATPVCSVALCDAEKVVSIRETHEKKSHASLLTVFINEILNEQGLIASDLDAVAVSKGPGSYTGLRIGVSSAKGISYGAGVPLVGIETTLSMFYGMKISASLKGELTADTLFCPMIDARRMEVFYSVFDSAGNAVRKISAAIIDENTFSDISEKQRIILAGDGAEKCRDVVRHSNLKYYDDFLISARYMIDPANRAVIGRKFENVAYFEPFYLKDFVATIPGKRKVS